MYEVITMDGKAKRDDMYLRYRTEGNDGERQVVKFSGCRPLMATEVNWAGEPTGAVGEIALDKGRIMYISTWSIAYPTRSY